jgi:hypothetical protein
MDDRVLGTRPHRRGELVEPLLEPVTGARDPLITLSRLGQAVQPEVERGLCAGSPPRHPARIDQADLAEGRAAVTCHRRQRIGEARHGRFRSLRIAVEQVQQVPTGEVLQDCEVGRVVGAVAVRQVNLGNAQAQRLQPSVGGFEQVEPATGRKRVGQVVVAVGQ